MRKIWDIHGGIHPAENKAQSLGDGIRGAALPPQLILPLSQHIGGSATARVAVGDTVLKGQCIADASGAVSLPLHAPTSGRISAIEERSTAHPSGLSAACIVIDSDGEDRSVAMSPAGDYRQMGADALLSCLRDAGIAGMGGAGFPSYIKLKQPPARRIDTLIINGSECEPYITADHALMREQCNEIAVGVAILAKILRPTQILLGIEDNKRDVVAGLENALSQQDFPTLTERDCRAEIVVIPTKYPSGGEKQLIQILTGKEVPSGGLPANLGIVCQNIGSTVAMHDAVCLGQPLISRITTVTGDAVKRPGNYRALLGTPVSFLLAQAGYDSQRNNRLVMGGPMMGFSLNSPHTPIVKTSNCILATTEEELPLPAPARACIRCGLCAEACPASLLPQQLFWFSQGKELDKLEAHNLADCIECGACAYVCPSDIPLVQYYRASKADIRQRKIDHQNAELSKQRYEARLQRLQRLEEEKLAARKARQEAARAAAQQRGEAGNEKAAEVAAALQRVKNKSDSEAGGYSQSDTKKSDDPVQRAIAAREKQQQEDQENPEQALLRTLENAQKRFDKAQLRLKNTAADDEHYAAFEAALGKCEEKLLAAQSALQAFRQQP